MGLLVGRCTTAGVTVGDERQRTEDCAGGWHARNLLFDRRVEAGVFELARGALLNEGMTIEDCDVGAVLNVYDNHIGSDGIASRADLARIKSIVARRARRMVVLNAEDPLCLAMRPVVRAERICLVGKEAAAPALRDHIAVGGCAVTLRGSPGEAMIVLADRGAVEDVIDPGAIPATLGGRHRGKAWNAMFAVAIAQAMGASLDHIRRGLRSFKPDLADSQGRFSIIDRHPFRVVLDHAFGQQAIEELANVVRQMPAAGRKLVYVRRTGQIPDELIRAHGRALSGAFDRYVCTNSSDRPRPDPEAVPGLLRDGILAGGAAVDAIVCIADPDEAVRYILGEARPGDLVVITTSLVDKVAAVIESFDPDPAGSMDGPSGMPRTS
jgi:cyanophycin synthetase